MGDTDVKRITGREMGTYVSRRKEFDNSKKSCYARWANIQVRHYDEHGEDKLEDTYERLYIVYSYGEHYPMFIYSEAANMWFGNSTRYSKTTSKHWGQAHPGGDVTPLCQKDMDLCVSKGVAWLVRWIMSDDNFEMRRAA